MNDTDVVPNVVPRPDMSKLIALGGSTLKKTKKNDETTSSNTVTAVSSENKNTPVTSQTTSTETKKELSQTTSTVSTPTGLSTELSPGEIEYFIQNASDINKNEKYMEKLKEKGRCTDNNGVQACTFEHNTNNYKIKVTKTKSGNTVDTDFELEKTGLSDEEIEKIHNALKDGKMSSFGVRKFIHEYTKRGNSEYRGYKKLIKGLQMLF